MAENPEAEVILAEAVSDLQKAAEVCFKIRQSSGRPFASLSAIPVVTWYDGNRAPGVNLENVNKFIAEVGKDFGFPEARSGAYQSLVYMTREDAAAMALAELLAYFGALGIDVKLLLLLFLENNKDFRTKRHEAKKSG